MLTKLRSALHSARGVPRLYGAATRAGASPTQAAQVIAASAAALSLAARRGAGVPGRQNAVRHFVWQAYLTGRYGERLATALAETQEKGTPDSRDSQVDQHNNAVGQEYGRTHADEIRRGSGNAALDRLAEVALRKWDAGELIWVR